jgi:hypothetical protein
VVQQTSGNKFTDLELTMWGKWCGESIQDIWGRAWIECGSNMDKMVGRVDNDPFWCGVVCDVIDEGGDQEAEKKK